MLSKLALYSHLEKLTENSREHLKGFGIFLIIAFPGFYFFNKFLAVEEGYESPMLRVSIGVLGGVLLLKDRWPTSLIKIFPLFWYFVLFCTLPFFFFYMLLNNPESNIWQINGLIGLTALTLFVGWIDYIFLISSGAVVASIAFMVYHQGNLALPNNLLGILGSYVGVISYLLLFNKKKDFIVQEKLEAMSNVCNNISHEMHTPLLSIHAAASGLNDHINALVDGYCQAKTAGLAVKPIPEIYWDRIPKLPGSIERESRLAFSIIEMMSVKLKEGVVCPAEEIFSASSCIQSALERFPFNDNQKSFLHVSLKNDFNIQAPELFIVHILFNLLKNALYQIKKVEKGEIFIWLDSKEGYNCIHFKDTSAGIEKTEVRKIFDRFYTKTKHGSGIGLAFCKSVMENIQGKISCDSIYGQETHFTLYFQPQQPFNI